MDDKEFKARLLEVIRDNLDVKVKLHKSTAYFDTTTLEVEILFDGEIIAACTDYPSL